VRRGDQQQRIDVGGPVPARPPVQAGGGAALVSGRQRADGRAAGDRRSGHDSRDDGFVGRAQPVRMLHRYHAAAGQQTGEHDEPGGGGQHGGTRHRGEVDPAVARAEAVRGLPERPDHGGDGRTERPRVRRTGHGYSAGFRAGGVDRGPVGCARGPRRDPRRHVRARHAGSRDVRLRDVRLRYVCARHVRPPQVRLRHVRPRRARHLRRRSDQPVGGCAPRRPARCGRGQTQQAAEHHDCHRRRAHPLRRPAPSGAASRAVHARHRGPVAGVVADRSCGCGRPGADVDNRRSER
jgi:hypothetical protein